MKRRGITLIELLITMALLGIISAVITSVYVTGFKTFQEELASSTVQSSSQTILDALITDTKNGLLIEESYDTYITSENTIIIRLPAVDDDKNILYDGSTMLFDRIIYYYAGNTIHKIVFADPESSRYSKNGIDTVLDKKILALSFAYEPNASAATLITATISSEIKVGNKTRAITVTGQARLRNHI